MAQQQWFILILQMLLDIFRPKTSTTFEVTNELISQYLTYVRGADSKTFIKQLNLYGFKKLGKGRFYTHQHLSHLLTNSHQSELKELFPRNVNACRKKKRSLKEEELTLARPQKHQRKADVPVLAPVDKPVYTAMFNTAMLDNMFGIDRLWVEDGDTFWWKRTLHPPCTHPLHEEHVLSRVERRVAKGAT